MRVIILSFLLAVVMIAFTIPAAEAHWIPRSEAQSIWYNHHKSWCGDGKAGGVDCASWHLTTCGRSGTHRYWCVYNFMEKRIKPCLCAVWVQTRYCTMSGVLRHRTPLYAYHDCGPWNKG